MSRSKSTPSSSKSSRHSTWHLPLAQRAALPDTPPLTSYLLRLMVAKRSNLCLSADVQTTSELLDVAEECGDSICLLKTHADMISDFGERSVQGLVEIAVRKKFLIFEDRKFGDIGSTVQSQYVAGPHRIASWASIVNAHIFPGPAIITALKSAASSAIAAYNTSTSTSISGGPITPAASYFNAKVPSTKSGTTPTGAHKRRQSQIPPENPKDSSSSDDDSDDDDDDDDSDENPDDKRHAPSHNKPSTPTNTTRSPTAIDIPERPAALDARKPSVVSINTTISSSTEYITSPSELPLEGGPAGGGAGAGGAASAGAGGSSGGSGSSTSAVLHERPPLARGLLLLAQMSSEDNLFTQPYTDKCVELARLHREFVLGFIAQESLNRGPGDNFVVMTPGVSLPPAPASSRSGSGSAAAAPAAKGDGLGQQYNSPRHLILEKGVDVIIVGRGILNAEDRGEEAERYRREGWDAIRERCERS